MKTRKATIADLKDICFFTDFWLAGRGIRMNAPGAVNDYFISPSQNKKYIEKYETWLVCEEKEIIAWAVIQHDGSLIHMMVAGTHRKEGIGMKFLKEIAPKKIHSKSNQSSGNPNGFYEKAGYVKTGTVQSKSRLDINKIKPNRKKIIDIYEAIQNV